MSIHLESVVLRRPEPEDIDELYLFRNDWQVARWLGGCSHGYAKADLRAWIESHRTEPNEALFVIAERETDRCLGHTGLYNIDYRQRNAEFAILLGSEETRGRGLGTQVTEAMLQYGFDQLYLHRIYLEVLVSNSRARHIYEKLGFRWEGTLRDALFRSGAYHDMGVMGILEDEYRAVLHKRSFPASATPPSNLQTVG